MVNTDAFDNEADKMPDPDQSEESISKGQPSGSGLKSDSRKGGGLALLAMSVALLALLAAIWLWWQGTQAEQQRASERQAEQQAYIDELKRLEDSLQAMQRSGSQRDSADSAALRSRLEALEASLNQKNNLVFIN